MINSYQTATGFHGVYGMDTTAEKHLKKMNEPNNKLIWQNISIQFVLNKFNKIN